MRRARHAAAAVLLAAAGVTAAFAAGPALPEAWRTLLLQAHGAIGPDQPLFVGQAAVAAVGIADGGSFEGGDGLFAATRRGLGLNNLCWWSEAGALAAGAGVTPARLRAEATLLGLTGQSWRLDASGALDEEQVEILRRILPPADLRPLDLYPSRRPLRVVHLRRPAFDAVALFQHGAQARDIVLTYGDLGLPIAPRLRFDFWNARYLGRSDRELRARVEPGGVALLHLVPVPAGAPHWLLSGEHVAGAGDVWRLVRDSGEMPGNPWLRTYEFRSDARAGDPSWLAFWLQTGPGTRLRVVEARDEAGVLERRQDGPVLWLTPRAPAAGARRIVLTAEGEEPLPDAAER